MAVNLTTEEKTAIIESHQKNIAYNQFNFQVSLVEENSKSSPDLAVIDSLNKQIADAEKQYAALDAQIAQLPTTSTPSN